MLLILVKEQRALPKPPSCYCGRMSGLKLVRFPFASSVERRY